MKKRKKSLVGWTFRNWYLISRRGILVDHSDIYKIKDDVEGEMPTKVRITIEEL